MNATEILSAVSACQYGVSDAPARLASEDDHPLIASKGAGSIHALRRHTTRGWRYLGFAVWSCRSQGWVCGSWKSPVDFPTAEDALRSMPWEG